MHIDVLTLFPEMFAPVLDASILGRAINRDLLSVDLINIRDYAENRQHKVDDYVFGGGTGLLMMPQPLFSCIEDVKSKRDTYVVYMTPQGKTLNDSKVRELSKHENLTVLCGHYEGIDQRVIDQLVDEEISIGDYVLTGGELPAMILIDAVSRQIPGVLGNELGSDEESFADGLLEYPQYTRPSIFRGLEVPSVLLSGHHANIIKWRRKMSLKKTMKNRPDLMEKVDLSKEDRILISELEKEECQ